MFSKEPAKSNVLFGLKEVIVTPHLGASTEEAETNCAVMVAKQIKDYLENGNIINFQEVDKSIPIPHVGWNDCKIKSENNNINSGKSLKIFFIKLISICVAGIVIINVIFNVFFAERLEKIDKLLFLNKSQYRNEVQDKIRKELNRGLKKENLFSEKDKILIYKLYIKIKKEFELIDKDKI